jgi:RimJ/RimL family protein N-acetyltransferase
MPFAPDDQHKPNVPDVAALNRPLSELGWQRWFVAVSSQDNRIAGHVDLKGANLRTGLHRCELGIGIERDYRGQGLGRQLMERAIDFARASDSLIWIDLRVFAHNAVARAVYRNLGFFEAGTLVDRFRIDGQVVDDVIMTLRTA